jgi:hypothetical protein
VLCEFKSLCFCPLSCFHPLFHLTNSDQPPPPLPLRTTLRAAAISRHFLLFHCGEIFCSSKHFNFCNVLQNTVRVQIIDVKMAEFVLSIRLYRANINAFVPILMENYVKRRNDVSFGPFVLTSFSSAHVITIELVDFVVVFKYPQNTLSFIGSMTYLPIFFIVFLYFFFKK